jgi:exopolysaccharide biosynthesis polyprenyl glycosylphosphotransferase
LLGYRVALRVWYRLNRLRSEFVARILVVGAGKVGREVVQQIQDYPGLGIKLIGFLDDNPKKVGTSVVGLPVLGQVDQIPTFMVRYAVDEVLITLPLRAHARLANLLNLLWNYPVRVRVVPDFSDLLFYGATLDSLGGVPLIGLRDPVIDDFQRFVKRLVDIVLSALGLLLMAPVMLATAIAIRLNGDGPIFYRADRVGENGRLFKMYKFRSMVTNADKMQNLVNRSDGQGNTFHKIAEDPRITPVGRFIRRTSIDELPQLINVLKGDMSLVGPRPELPWLVEKYEAWQRKRFAVPQGVTGWWQINGRSNKPMHLNTSQDLYYIQNYSLWLDIQIMWKTIAAVLRRNGAY